MRTITLLFSFLLAGCSLNTNHRADTGERPNIVLIMVDDLGWSDTSPYGGEIPTPAIKALAAQGLQLTNFHTAMKCNPSRAMLLTGFDNNIAASGPRRSYHLRADVPTLAEQLRVVGYQTYMAGKWDLGGNSKQRPFDRGFDATAALLPGAGLHFRAHDASDVRTDGTTVGYSVNGRDAAMPERFYSTHYYTEQIKAFIDSGKASNKPFFAYLAYTAPHYPLQAPAPRIDAFKGWYEDGHRAVHKARLRRLRDLGIYNKAHWPIPELPEWESLTSAQRAYEAKRMQIYAAMIAELDAAIADLLEFLERSNLADSTLVIFTSDNGADGTARGVGLRPEVHDNATANLGSASSYVTQGLNWAQVSSTPWRLVKGHPTEGGTRAPLIARWPGQIAAGRVSDHWLRISDLAPTILQLAGSQDAANSEPLYGRSALPLLLDDEPVWNDEARVHAYVEHRLGGASVLAGDHKLVWWKTRGNYREPMLFNVSEDPAETHDLASQQPGRRAELLKIWSRYRESAGDEIAEADPNRN